VRPVLKEAVLLPKQGVKEQWIIVPKATPEDEEMTASNDVNRVELETSQPIDHLHDATGISAETWISEILSYDGDLTGHGI